MSYDFDLFEMQPGMDLDAALEQREHGAPTDEAMHSRQAVNPLIVQTLIHQNPRFEVTETPSYFELDTGIEGNGIQIELFDLEASVSVPYWHAVPTSRQVFEEIWGYLRAIQHNTNYVIYDQQIGRLLNLNADFEAVLALYSMMVEQIRNQPG
jgi:hypothetical protein